MEAALVVLALIANVAAAFLLFRRTEKPLPSPPAPSPEAVREVEKAYQARVDVATAERNEVVATQVEDLKDQTADLPLEDLLAYAKDTGEKVRDEPEPGTTIHEAGRRAGAPV